MNKCIFASHNPYYHKLNDHVSVPSGTVCGRFKKAYPIIGRNCFHTKEFIMLVKSKWLKVYLESEQNNALYQVTVIRLTYEVTVNQAFRMYA